MKNQAQKHQLDERIDLTVGFSISAIPEDLGENTELGKMLVEKSGTEIQKSLEYGEIEVVVSNSGTDRHGESIRMEGIDTKQVLRNPVVLWAHQYSGLPIGKITKLWKSKGNLNARIKLDHDIYEFANTVYQMVLRGTINAVSIGGIVKEWNSDYTVVEKMEMIELSVVPVGAHPDALVTAKSLGMPAEKLAQQFEQFVKAVLVDKFNDMPQDNIKLNIDVLKTLTSALESSYKGNPAVSDKSPKTRKVKRIITLSQSRKLAIQIDKQAELIISAISSEFNSNK